jgi:Ca-activated chloride channel family protein
LHPADPDPCCAAPVLAEGKSIIVLDASGSMWGQIDGRAKLEIAREALGSVLSGMDPATEIGLMAYGHREKGSCEDIELVVPPLPAPRRRSPTPPTR